MIPGSANPLLLKSAAAASYQIERSLRFNSSDSAYLSRTPSTAGNRKTWTWAGWVKLGTNFGVRRMLFGGGTIANSIPNTYLEITDSAQLGIDSPDPPSFSNAARVRTTAVLRDPSAWYHIVFSIDTTQATAANRIKIYINGVEQTSYSSTTYPSQNYDSGINSTQIQTIGAYPEAAFRAGLYFDGYLADIHFIDGQALTPSSFTEVSATTGQLIPKAYTGTFTGNSFWLKFADNSAATATTLGKDSSGLGNNWTPNNLSVTAGAGNDSLVDTPTSYGTDTGAGGEVRGNYATWNALAKGSDCTLSNGNLDVAWGSAGSTTQGSATIGMSSGKWYWETTITASSASPTNAVLGITTKPFNDSEYPGYSATSWGYRGSDGQKWTNTSGSSYGASYANGDVVGVAFDADNGTLTFYKNGSSQGTAFTGLTSGPYFPAIGDQSSSQTFSAASNFGQRAFAYTAPSGFKALCDTNLPAPVVAKPNTVMDVKLWTGNSGTQTISGLGFSPDLIWAKVRNATASNQLFDVIRGVNKALYSDLTSAEFTDTDAVTAFNSDGWTMGAEGGLNFNGNSYVAWTWDAGTTTSSNVAGSITSSVRANQSAGFSIATYTGNNTANATFGHGLGVTPEFVVIKKRSSTGNWIVYHKGMTSSAYYMYLNATDAQTNQGGAVNTWGVSSTLITLKELFGDYNASGATYVAYCFAPVSGYSAMGSYNTTGSADGPYIHLGFRPRLVLFKATTSHPYGSWRMYDSARGSYNVIGPELYPNSASSEYGGGVYMDFTANGFKIRENSFINDAGHTFIYCAWAESPFQYARAR